MLRPYGRHDNGVATMNGRHRAKHRHRASACGGLFLRRETGSGWLAVAKDLRRARHAVPLLRNDNTTAMLNGQRVAKDLCRARPA